MAGFTLNEIAGIDMADRLTPREKEIMKDPEIVAVHQKWVYSLPTVINISGDRKALIDKIKAAPQKDKRLNTSWLVKLGGIYLVKMEEAFKALIISYNGVDVNKKDSAMDTESSAAVDKPNSVTNTHVTVDVSKPQTLNQMQKSSLDFMDKGVRRGVVREAQVDHFCDILMQNSVFESVREVIPELQLDQSHDTHQTNPLITRILQRTKLQRNPAPLQPVSAPKKPKKSWWVTPKYGRATQVEDLNFPVKKPFEDEETRMALHDVITGGVDDVEKTLATTMDVNPLPWFDPFASLAEPGNYGPNGRFGTTRKGDRLRYMVKTTLEARGEAWTPENYRREVKNFEAWTQGGEEPLWSPYLGY